MTNSFKTSGFGGGANMTDNERQILQLKFQIGLAILANVALVVWLIAR
jgi:hypothetical protein